MSLIIDVFMCREDNYGYLLRDTESGRTAAIDAPDANTIRARLAHHGWTLNDIFVTHRHADHTDGILPLKKEFGCKVTGPKVEAQKIKGIDETVGDGDAVVLGATTFEVRATPGHTMGHVVYHDAQGRHLFTGDALFSLGCGKLFEGKATAMWEGLSRLRALPDETLIYCGHEYTLSNARFARSIEPGNVALRIRAAEVERMRAADRFTIPVTLGMEKATNPFLRVDVPAVASAIGLPNGKPGAVFAALRKAKDNFKPDE